MLFLHFGAATITFRSSGKFPNLILISHPVLILGSRVAFFFFLNNYYYYRLLNNEDAGPGIYIAVWLLADDCSLLCLLLIFFLFLKRAANFFCCNILMEFRLSPISPHLRKLYAHWMELLMNSQFTIAIIKYANRTTTSSVSNRDCRCVFHSLDGRTEMLIFWLRESITRNCICFES